MENVKSLKEIREFLKQKNEYWFQKERTDLDLKYYVPTDYICEALEQYEVGIPKDIYDSMEEQNKDKWYDCMVYETYLEENCIEDFGGDNTYNHSGRPQNDFNWHTFKMEDDKYIVVLRFHIGGDIRGNYTDDIVLEFEYDTQFYEVLNDLICEYCLAFDLEVDNKIYEITPQIFDECVEVYDRERDDYIYHIWGSDDKECIEQIREQVKEIQKEEEKEVNKYMLDNDIIIMAEHDNFLNIGVYDLDHWENLLNETLEYIIQKDTKTTTYYKSNLAGMIERIKERLGK